MSFGITELLIVLAIVIVLFGAKRIKNLGPDLGSAIKGFRSALSDNNDEEKASTDSATTGNVENVSSEADSDDTPKQDTNVLYCVPGTRACVRRRVGGARAGAFTHRNSNARTLVRSITTELLQCQN